MNTEPLNPGILVLKGEFTQDNTHEFRQLLSEFAEDNKHIDLDVSLITFFDSASLGVLVAFNRILKEVGGSVRIINPKPYLKTLFALTNLDKHFQIIETP
mgnify:CR=1 FL=1